MSAWPKLSAELRVAETLERCQSCGDVADLQRWREHDDADEPTTMVIVLCKPCADKVIEPHPRLYSRLQRHEPSPGSMPTCEDCALRTGTACGHPDFTPNGGGGLRLEFPKPSVQHIDYLEKGKRRGVWQTVFKGSVVCTGKVALCTGKVAKS